LRIGVSLDPKRYGDRRRDGQHDQQRYPPPTERARSNPVAHGIWIGV
jgi:hypothetical protein